MRLLHARSPLFFAAFLLAVPLLTGADGSGCGQGKIVIGDDIGPGGSTVHTGMGGSPSSSGTVGMGGSPSSSGTVGMGGSPSAGTGGSTVSCPDGLAILAPSPTAIQQIVVSGGHVFWITIDGQVHSVPVCGGVSSTELAFGPSDPLQLTVDATYVYWTAGDSVLKVPIAGGPVTTLASGQMYPNAIAVDSTHVYWLASGNLYSAPLDGGAPTLLAATAFGAGIAPSMVVDSEAVYCTSGTGDTLLKVPLAGGTAVPFVTGQIAISGLAIDATNVYWTTALSNAGTVMKAPLAGGPPTTLASGQLGPYSVRVDALNAYWTAGLTSETVMTVPLAGGSPTTITTESGFGAPTLAVDASSIYWVEGATGGYQIMRLTPK